MINESSQPVYDILIVNQDKGTQSLAGDISYSIPIIESLKSAEVDSLGIPIELQIMGDRQEGINKLKSKHADALIIIPEKFSEVAQSILELKQAKKVEIEFIGDPTSMEYMICAILAEEFFNQAVFNLYGIEKPYRIRETFLGGSTDVDEFSLYIPGILIISIIMLMFTASIAIITEVENKTILRLKLSKIGSFSLLGGVSIVQVMIGIVSVFITLGVAIWMGFDYSGSILIFLFIAVLTCLSIIAFSIIIAGFTKTVNEILIVGNFPLFLFMFFTGAAFPISGNELFSVAGYKITLQGLMSPTHAISALKKTLIFDMGIKDIIPEIVSLIILTIAYFFFGVWIFRRRHMKVG